MNNNSFFHSMQENDYCFHCGERDLDLCVDTNENWFCDETCQETWYHNREQQQQLLSSMDLGAIRRKEKIVYMKKASPLFVDHTKFRDSSRKRPSILIIQLANSHHKEEESDDINKKPKVIELTKLEESFDGSSYHLIYKETDSTPFGIVPGEKVRFVYYDYYDTKLDAKPVEINVRIPKHSNSFTMESKEGSNTTYISFTYNEYGLLTIAFIYQKKKGLYFQWYFTEVQLASNIEDDLYDRSRLNERTLQRYDNDSIKFFSLSTNELDRNEDLIVSCWKLKGKDASDITLFRFDDDEFQQFGKQSWKKWNRLQLFSLKIPFDVTKDSWEKKDYYEIHFDLRSVLVPKSKGRLVRKKSGRVLPKAVIQKEKEVKLPFDVTTISGTYFTTDLMTCARVYIEFIHRFKYENDIETYEYMLERVIINKDTAC